MIPEYLDRHLLVYQRDAVEFLDMLHPESVQLVWTSPPNGAEDLQRLDDLPTGKDHSHMESIELCAAMADAASRVLTPSGVLAVCLNSRNTESAVSAISKRTHLKLGWILGDWSDPDIAIAVFYKETPKLLDGYFFTPDQDYLEIITTFIDQFTDPGEIVVDPFCGSGYVVEAAVKAGRIAIVNDIDPEAVAATITRYKENCAE